mmetsp:Transcript_11538/g.35646  ORF Transcript_11538/g.35646 Transcript_11538/m.35646 type:complete len:304 (-) Transcript_11538:348-1259(-)
MLAMCSPFRATSRRRLTKSPTPSPTSARPAPFPSSWAATTLLASQRSAAWPPSPPSASASSTSIGTQTSRRRTSMSACIRRLTFTRPTSPTSALRTSCKSASAAGKYRVPLCPSCATAAPTSSPSLTWRISGPRRSLRWHSIVHGTAATPCTSPSTLTSLRRALSPAPAGPSPEACYHVRPSRWLDSLLPKAFAAWRWSRSHRPMTALTSPPSWGFGFRSTCSARWWPMASWASTRASSTSPSCPFKHSLLRRRSGASGAHALLLGPSSYQATPGARSLGMCSARGPLGASVALTVGDESEPS